MGTYPTANLSRDIEANQLDSHGGKSGHTGEGVNLRQVTFNLLSYVGRSDDRNHHGPISSIGMGDALEKHPTHSQGW